jgi:hypothetical protein
MFQRPELPLNVTSSEHSPALNFLLSACELCRFHSLHWVRHMNNFVSKRPDLDRIGFRERGRFGNIERPGMRVTASANVVDCWHVVAGDANDGLDVACITSDETLACFCEVVRVEEHCRNMLVN